MKYVKFKEKHGYNVIDLEGIRLVSERSSNPCGGAPHNDSGKITYRDGTILEVSRECARAVQKALATHTILT